MTLDEKIQALYSDEDSLKLTIYRGMATDAIRNYMNVDDDNTTIEQKYESALIQLIGNKIKYDNTDGVKSYIMSKTSVTYGNNNGLSITDDIKSLLPPPFVRLLG
jgi:Skp family chaperone for outer membrane proteins